MKFLMNKFQWIRMIVIGMSLLLIISTALLLPHGQRGMLLLFFVLFVAIVGLFYGLLHALGFAVLFFFIVGSVYFWFTFSGRALSGPQVPITYLFVWMVALLLIAFLSGRLSERLKNVEQDTNDLRNQIQTLVSVDPLTSFDNRDRMFLELQSELNRARRYGNTFTLLLIKVIYSDELRKLYGKPERNRVLLHISKTIVQLTRASDLKFRPEKDIFAVLLTNTSVSNIQVVISKLDEALKVHRLLNENYITLTLSYGYVEFNAEVDDEHTLYELAKEQVSHSVS